jgi:hypothetical protein
VIVASVAGAIGALAALAFGIPPLAVVLTGAAAFVLALVLMGTWGQRSFTRDDSSLEARFPSPKTL